MGKIINCHPIETAVYCPGSLLFRKVKFLNRTSTLFMQGQAQEPFTGALLHKLYLFVILINLQQ